MWININKYEVKSMSFLGLAQKRFSARIFDDRPVEDEKLMQVLEAGRIAPSAVNYQPWCFIVVREPDLRRKVASAYGRDWILKAPVIIVACGNHNHSWRRRFDGKDHCDIDAAIAIDHMTLAAADLGLGTCWVCAFDPGIVREVLKLPAHIEPIALLPLGYPVETADPNRHGSSRKKIDEIVFWDGFGKS